jgi:hypothetical protein
MPTIFDHLYREFCRARLAEMRKQLLISPERHEVVLAQGLDGLMKTVWVYVNMSKQVGDKDHLKIFATADAADAAETWFQENDPEGVAFEYEVLE